MSPEKHAAYPEYKESGVRWLGRIPGTWRVCRVKDFVQLHSGYPFASEQFDPEEGIPLIRIRDIAFSRTEVRVKGDVPQDSLIRDGDVLIGMDGDFNVAWWNAGEAALNQRVACLRAGTADLQRFLFYSLPFNMQIVNDLTYFTTVKHLSNTDILKTRFAMPSAKELSSIAKFLDYETAKIDALIEKQQQLIALLEEKRQAVISHAVTKGLNPDAPMRDSGVEWLGKVPAHWRSGKTKLFAELRSGHTPSRSKPEYWEDCHIPWFSLADVWQLRDGQQIYLGETKEKISDLGLANSAADLLPAGTVILSRTASVGFSGIMPVPMATTQDFVNWIPGESLISEYLLFVFRGMSPEFDRLKMGSTHKTIYMPDVMQFSCPVPPLDEQRAIVSHLTENLDILQNAAERANDLMGLLKERRTALISAAVTGKIDVRGWKPPEPKAEGEGA